MDIDIDIGSLKVVLVGQDLLDAKNNNGQKTALKYNILLHTQDIYMENCVVLEGHWYDEHLPHDISPYDCEVSP